MSQLHLTINIEDVTAPRYKANYGNDSAIVREREESLDLEWKLHSYINTTFNSSFALLLKAERISHMKVHIMLELGSYPYMDSPDTESHMAMLDVERSFLNVLEDMRKPVYDLVHAGARVIITWDEEREPRYQPDMRGDPLQRPLVGLFHLSKKDWEEVCNEPRMHTITHTKSKTTVLTFLTRRKPIAWLTMVIISGLSLIHI